MTKGYFSSLARNRNKILFFYVFLLLVFPPTKLFYIYLLTMWMFFALSFFSSSHISIPFLKQTIKKPVHLKIIMINKYLSSFISFKG